MDGMMKYSCLQLSCLPIPTNSMTEKQRPH